MPSRSFVASTAAMRVYSVSRDAGRPMPEFSHDDMLNFMVTEAVVARAREEAEELEEKADKQREVDAWRRNAKAELPG